MNLRKIAPIFKWTQIDGRYLWLPITSKGNKIEFKWMYKWDLDVFKK
jgi:hypothetical protein